MLCWRLSPVSMILATMVPIPKNRCQSMADSNNYRPITLISILGKVLEWVVKESASLVSSDLQFGFKQGGSKTQCSFAMFETISHYNYNGSIVPTHYLFTCHLDAETSCININVLQFLIPLYIPCSNLLHCTWPCHITKGLKRSWMRKKISYDTLHFSSV
jgi:hypothetical protein